MVLNFKYYLNIRLAIVNKAC